MNADVAGAADRNGSSEEPASGGKRGKMDPVDPKVQMARLDALIAAETDEERLRAGLGIRLALGLAQEMREGKPIGSETTELVAGWMHDYGQDTVDAATRVAREFLIKPEELRKSLGQRLGLEGET
jgi:hypothetical protein